MSTIALIQARMGSSRLPGKVLMELAEKPVLQHVVERVQASKLVHEAVVVTSINREDIPIVAWCSTHTVRVYCGSEEDVLDRYYQAARLIGATVVVRITADCPLMDPEVIDLVLGGLDDPDVDYVNNCGRETWPDGLDVEAFRFNALERAWTCARLPSEREHVTPYIRNHPEEFRTIIVDHEPNLGGLRWTLDQREDYEFLSRVYTALGDERGIFGMNRVLDLLRRQPELQSINSFVVRNEGLIKSLDADKVRAEKGR